MSKIEKIRADLMAEREKELVRRSEYREMAKLARESNLSHIAEKLENIADDEAQHIIVLDKIISDLKEDVGK